MFCFLLHDASRGRSNISSRSRFEVLRANFTRPPPTAKKFCSHRSRGGMGRAGAGPLEVWLVCHKILDVGRCSRAVVVVRRELRNDAMGHFLDFGDAFTAISYALKFTAGNTTRATWNQSISCLSWHTATGLGALAPACPLPLMWPA